MLCSSFIVYACILYKLHGEFETKFNMSSSRSSYGMSNSKATHAYGRKMTPHMMFLLDVF